MDLEDFKIAALPFISHLYDSYQRRLYDILRLRREKLRVEYLPIDPDSSTSYYSGYVDTQYDYENDIRVTLINGDVIILKKERDNAITVELVFLTPFLLDEEYLENNFDYSIIKNVVRSLVLIGNYGPSSFGEEIAEQIQREDHRIGPYTASLDMAGVQSKLGRNPIENDFEEEGFVWNFEPDAEALIVTLPFRLTRL